MLIQASKTVIDVRLLEQRHVYGVLRGHFFCTRRWIKKSKLHRDSLRHLYGIFPILDLENNAKVQKIKSNEDRLGYYNNERSYL